MKVLRFTLIALLALLLVAGLVLPGIIGPKVEEIWQQQLARQADVTSAGYQRNWFRSEAISHLRGKQGITELYSDIQHGPVLFTEFGPRLGAVYAKTQLTGEQLEPALRAQLEVYYGPIIAELNKSPLLIETLVGIDSRIVNTIRLLPIARNEENEQITFAGMTLQLNTDARGKQLTGNFTLGEFTHVQRSREILHFAVSNGHYSLTSGGSGRAEITLPLVRTESDSEPLELRDLDFTYNAKQLSANALHITTDLQIAKVQSTTPISALQQQLNFPQLTYADLHHYLYTLLLTPAGKRNWSQIMQRPLQLQQQLKMELAKGSAQMQLDVNWRGMPRNPRQVSNQRFFWLNALSGTMHIAAREQALLQTPLAKNAATLRQYGLLLENNGELQLDLEIENGNLKVNGDPLPTDLFLLALTGKF